MYNQDNFNDNFTVGILIICEVYALISDRVGATNKGKSGHEFAQEGGLESANESFHASVKRLFDYLLRNYFHD